MNKKAPSHLISGVFVFLLLGLFAVFSTVMVLLGVKAYRGAVARNGVHNTARISSSYLRSMIRADDEAGALRIERVPGLVSGEDGEDRQVEVDCVALYNSYDDEAYVTRIYVWDGSLREWFTEASEPFYADAGDVVCPADSLEAELSGSLLTLRVATGEETAEVDIALHADRGVSE